MITISQRPQDLLHSLNAIINAFQDIYDEFSDYPKFPKEHIHDRISIVQYLSPIGSRLNANDVTRTTFEKNRFSYLSTAQEIKDRDLIIMFWEYIPPSQQDHISTLQTSAEKAEYIRRQVLTDEFRTSIIEIDCVGKKIFSIPPEVFHLTNLQYLNLCDNEISILPEAIDELQHLEVLHLTDNKIKTLPHTIWTLRNLEELSLGNLQISGPLPQEIGQLHRLSWLNLENNRITTLPSDLTNLVHLRFFIFGGNKIFQISENLLSFFGQVPHVYLQDNPLSQETIERVSSPVSESDTDDEVDLYHPGNVDYSD